MDDHGFHASLTLGADKPAACSQWQQVANLIGAMVQGQDHTMQPIQESS